MADEEAKVPRLMTTKEVAEMLRMSPITIEKMRLEGRGPPYRRLGVSGKAKVIYTLDDVMRWLDQYSRTGTKGTLSDT